MRFPTKRRWKQLLLLLVCVEIFVNVYGCASSLVLHPSTHHIDAKGAVAKKIPFGDSYVEVWTSRSPACGDGEPKASVLEFCGNGTRAEEIATWVAQNRWAKWPIELWVLNYPGYGGSPGKARLASIPPAALTAYDALHAAAPDRPIFLESNSLGGCSVTYVAGRRPVAAAIITNPPPLKRLIWQHHGWWNLWLLSTPVAWQVPTDMNTPDTGPLCTAPACFLLADGDWVIPPKYHDMVVTAYGGPKTVIDVVGADHNHPMSAESEAELAKWIDQQWARVFPTTQPTK